MKNYKRWFWSSILVAVVWFSSFGCITKAVWKDDYKSKPYQESLVAFYTNTKSHHIAFLGVKFHYIFDKRTEAFIELLNNKDLLNLQQENLQINASAGMPESSDIYTDIIVRFNIEKLTAPQKSWLLSHSYHETIIPLNSNKQREMQIYINYYHIKGKRYLANPKVNEKVQKLKNVILLNIIEYQKEKGNIVRKIALTPLSITADAIGGAVLLVGTVIMLPIRFVASIFD